MRGASSDGWKDIGITLLSVVVAIVEFIASNIGAQFGTVSLCCVR